MDEISPKELYTRLLLHGLFSEKLPPFFDGKLFTSYCRRSERPPFRPKSYASADYYSVRHNHELRHLSIPAPMPYERLAGFLREHWPDLQNYFRTVTASQRYMVSRVHVRKLQTHNALFELNYHNFHTDGYPEFNLQIGAKYLVSSDISQFFPSLDVSQITRALLAPWDQPLGASSTQGSGTGWAAKLTELISAMNSGSSTSLLIGPHVCNLLSEILLCRLDQRLCGHWCYTRSIDDFRCFARDRADADEFIALLALELEECGLKINSAKTAVHDLPMALINEWPRRLRDYAASIRRHDDKKSIDTEELQALLDFSIQLMLENDDSAAVINYMLSILSGRHFNRYTASHLAERVIDLSFTRPYLVPLLGSRIFEVYPVTRYRIFPHYADRLYRHFNEAEPLSYLLYYAVRYDHHLRHFSVRDIIAKNDCILLLAALIYCRHFGDKKSIAALRAHARELKRAGQMENYWPFLFEILPVSALSGDWRRLKAAEISFLKREFRSC